MITFDLGCALQVFARAPGMSGAPGYYDLVTCGPSRRTPTSDGFDLAIDRGLEALTDAETVIVPGYATWAQPPATVVTRALAAAADRGARMMSICVGAFALAHAGILDGRRATTHWMVTGLLAEQFPQVEVVADVLYVDEGQVPKRWLLQMRLERARELLEATEIPVEQVAAQAGFPSAGALRAHFAEELRTTPSAYRRTYRGQPATVS